MKLDEIVMTGGIDENIDKYIHNFDKSNPIKNKFIETKLGQGFFIKKNIDEYGNIEYGIFNQNNDLISYLFLSNIKNDLSIRELYKGKNLYQEKLILTSFRYRKQGYITFLFDYAINVDNLKIIASDSSQTNDAKKKWKSFRQGGKFKVKILDVLTGKTRAYNGDDEPWDGKHTTLLLAEKIQYSRRELDFIALMEKTRKWSGRIDIEYGPRSSSSGFYNP